MTGCSCPFPHADTYDHPSPGYDFRCQRCGHEWRARHPGTLPPLACGKCRSHYWSRKKLGKGKGRKKSITMAVVRVPVGEDAPQPTSEELFGMYDGPTLPPPPAMIERMRERTSAPVADAPEENPVEEVHVTAVDATPAAEDENGPVPSRPPVDADPSA